jgi:hypothetical protein
VIWLWVKNKICHTSTLEPALVKPSWLYAAVLTGRSFPNPVVLTRERI